MIDINIPKVKSMSPCVNYANYNGLEWQDGQKSNSEKRYSKDDHKCGIVLKPNKGWKGKLKTIGQIS